MWRSVLALFSVVCGILFSPQTYACQPGQTCLEETTEEVQARHGRIALRRHQRYLDELKAEEKKLTIQRAQNLVNGFNSINLDGPRADYQMFRLIQRHIGLINVGPGSIKEATASTPESLKIFPGSYTPAHSRRNPHTGKMEFVRAEKSYGYYQTFQLEPGSLKLFVERLAEFNPKNFDDITDPIKRKQVQKTMEEARRITRLLKQKTETMSGAKMGQVIHAYAGDGYVLRKFIKKTGLEITPEIIRFAGAMLIVRFMECFGKSMGTSIGGFMQVTGPSGLRASIKDPACMTDIMNMLQTKVFYAGFTGFIIGSRVANFSTLWALRGLGYHPGSKTHHVVSRYLLPNLALAVGFLSDHLIKTLMTHKEVTQCMFGFNEKNTQVLNGLLDTQVVTSNEEFEYVDLVAAIEKASGMDPGFGEMNLETPEQELQRQIQQARTETAAYNHANNCAKAMAYLNSDQFVKKELYLGIGGLITTAAALSVSQKGVQWATMKAAERSAIIKSISLFFSATTGWGLAIRQGIHITAFLGLYSILDPYYQQFFNAFSLQDDVNDQAEALIQGYSKINLTKDNLGLHQKKQCPKFYSGKDGDKVPVCTRVPLIAELKSMADYASNWRQSKILADFTKTNSMWKIKLSSFISNYMGSQILMQQLVRSREMHLNDGVSQFEEAHKERELAKARQILRHSLRSRQDWVHPSELEPMVEEQLSEIYRDAVERIENPQSNSSILALKGYDPKKWVWSLLFDLHNRQSTLKQNAKGKYFTGLFGLDNAPTQTEIDQLRNQIKDFLENVAPPDIHRQFPGLTQWGDFPTIPSSWRDLINNDNNPFLPPELRIAPYSVATIQHFLFPKFPREQNPQAWDESVAMGFMFFSGWSRRLFQKIPRSNRLHTLSDGSRIYNPHKWNPENRKALKEIEEALYDHAPLFPNESTFYASSRSGVFLTKKEDYHGQWNELNWGLDTSDHMNYVLSQLMCGYRPPTLSGDDLGFTLEFEFPMISHDRGLCSRVYLPGYLEKAMSPSPTRSVFVDRDGQFHMGLHKAFVEAGDKANSENPLSFSNEENFSTWWNEDIFPHNYKKLARQKVYYDQAIRETFVPHTNHMEIEEGSIEWAVNATHLGGDPKRGPVQATPAVSNLAQSMRNQVLLYRDTLRYLLGPEFHEIQIPRLDGGLPALFGTFSSCLGKLIQAIPSNYYNQVKPGCDVIRNLLKSTLREQNGKYSGQEWSGILKMEDDIYENSPHKQELIKDRILIEVANGLDSLVAEIHQYFGMVNGQFNFELDTGEYQ